MKPPRKIYTMRPRSFDAEGPQHLRREALLQRRVFLPWIFTQPGETLADIRDGVAVGAEFFRQLFPCERRRDRRAATCARGIGGHGRGLPPVAQIIDEYLSRTRALGHLRGVAVGQGLREVIGHGARKGLHLVPRSLSALSGTTTCSPLPPVVLTKLRSPISSSRPFTRCAASITRAHGSSGAGSRSKVMRSGLSRTPQNTPQKNRTSTPICTRLIRPGSEFAIM